MYLTGFLLIAKGRKCAIIMRSSAVNTLTKMIANMNQSDITSHLVFLKNVYLDMTFKSNF